MPVYYIIKSNELTYNLIRNFTMPQDSSFISHSTEGSSAGRLSENSCSKQAAIVPDMSGNFFVMKQTIDMPKYSKWLVTEQPKATE